MRDGWKRGTSVVRIWKPFMLCIKQEAISPSVPPTIVKLYVLLVSCFLAFLTVPIQLLYWDLQKCFVEYVMVRTKISARSNTTNSSVCATSTSLMYTATSLGVGSVWFWFSSVFHKSHFFLLLRNRVLIIIYFGPCTRHHARWGLNLCCPGIYLYC